MLRHLRAIARFPIPRLALLCALMVSLTVSTTTAISGVTVQHGNTMDVAGGGGIYNGGNLTLNNSSVISNTAAATTTSYISGGGIANTGVLTVTNSTIGANSAPNPN